MSEFELLCGMVAAFSDEHWRLYVKVVVFKGSEFTEGVRGLAENQEKALDGYRRYLGSLLVEAMAERNFERAFKAVQNVHGMMTSDVEKGLETLELLASTSRMLSAKPPESFPKNDYW